MTDTQTTTRNALDREIARDVFHLRILRALDEAAREVFDSPRFNLGAGATDRDLPRLFRAIDEQLDILAERYGVTWQEEV